MRGDPEGLRVHVPDARELLLVQRVSLGLATSAAPGQFFHDRHSSSVRSAPLLRPTIRGRVYRGMTEKAVSGVYPTKRNRVTLSATRSRLSARLITAWRRWS